MEEDIMIDARNLSIAKVALILFVGAITVLVINKGSLPALTS